MIVSREVASCQAHRLRQLIPGRYVHAGVPFLALRQSSRVFNAVTGVSRGERKVFAPQAVEIALELYGAPVYVRKQIVHNSHVVASLEARGAMFVEETGEVPEGAVVVFSAHGVAPQVREDARKRGLRAIDATCPLVTKVHNEARRFAAQGFSNIISNTSDDEKP